jgi:lipopolysaccharide export system protein LptC
MRAQGSVRVVIAVILLVAVVAVIAWNRERATETAPPVTAANPRPSKPAADLRDASRERPERERTSRPGGQ